MLRPLCASWAYGSGTDGHPECARQELMRTLSISISSLRACSACASVFLFLILYTLSMRVRKWCVHWACASGTDACIEHARQELMNTLSIRARNWCVHWAYGSGTNACTERIPLKKCWAYASGTDAYPEHTGQELMRSLSIRVRNWCVPWAYTSVSCADAQHKHKNSKFEKVPSKYAEYVRKELMRALSVHVRNWCMHWAYTSGTDAQAQHAHQNLNDA